MWQKPDEQADRDYHCIASFICWQAAETACERTDTASVDNFIISFEHRNFLQLFFILINKLKLLKITVKPSIHLVTAFCTAASVAFPLSDMWRYMSGLSFGTCKLSALYCLINFSFNICTASGCPSNSKCIQYLCIAGPNVSLHFIFLYSPDSSSVSCSSDKSFSSFFEVDRHTMSGIGRRDVSPYDFTTSESSTEMSLSLSSFSKQ